MKVRDISLMAAGAIVAVAAITFASSLFYPTKAQAQGAAAAPGATAITVTANPATQSLVYNTANGMQICGGVITINDFANRKVTVVAYVNTINYTSGGYSLTPPTILLSTNASFIY